MSSDDLPIVTLDPRLGPAAAASDPLSDDAKQRVRELGTQVIARYPRPRSALMPLLYLVQAEQGYVSPDGIKLVADMLNLTTAEVSAVSTFYTMYKRRPCGDYTVGVCTNTLCAIMGGDEIFARLKDHLGVGHDEEFDVEDPVGRSQSEYEHTAAELDDLLDRLVGLAWPGLDAG